ncbi:MAG: hypothetical protein GY739_12540 [Mesoflavibacter sp.]|nr:hypothetical protein [Mesoflavibacter sp.]
MYVPTYVVSISNFNNIQRTFYMLNKCSHLEIIIGRRRVAVVGCLVRCRVGRGGHNDGALGWATAQSAARRVAGRQPRGRVAFSSTSPPAQQPQGDRHQASDGDAGAHDDADHETGHKSRAAVGLYEISIDLCYCISMN